MVVSRGLNSSAIRNRIPAVNAVRPVLPPSETPEADSTNVVTVDVPRTAPRVVAAASANSAPLILGSLPSLSRKPAFVETPINVPSVSNRSTNRNAKMTTIKSKIEIPEKVSLPATGIMLGGAEMMPVGIREYAPASTSTTYSPVS